MIYVIRSSGVHQGTRDWRLRAAIFVVATVASSGTAGIMLGAGGALLSDSDRVRLGLLACVGAAAIGSVELRFNTIPVLQFSRETRRRGNTIGTVRTAAGNGASVGLGFLTRIGYWAWYVIPFSAFLLADPVAGAAIYGSYGLARGTAPLMILAWQRRTYGTPRATPAPIALLRAAASIRMLTAAQLIILGTSGALILA